MKNRLWIALSLFSVALAAYLGDRLNPNATSVPSTVSMQSITEEITGWLQNANVGHAIQDVHVITYEQMHGERFALVSYEMDAKPLLASIAADKQGRAISAMTPVQESTRVPWEYTDMVLSGNGFHVIGGIVHDHSIKKLVMTFTNGFVATVPVVGGYVFYVNPAPLLPRSDAKNAIGVTASGQIVEYHGNQ